MRTLTLLALFILAPAVAYGQSLGWAALKQTIRLTYPEVRQISTDSLAAWLASRDREAPLLLDARAEAEFAVSHLLGARRLAPDTPDLDALAGLPRDTPIVAYCSVGYRSSALAERLAEAGFTNVANLEGSLFAWANEGRTVYRNGQAVRQVHPYDTLWGRLLNKALHAYTPTPDR